MTALCVQTLTVTLGLQQRAVAKVGQRCFRQHMGVRQRSDYFPWKEGGGGSNPPTHTKSLRGGIADTLVLETSAVTGVQVQLLPKGLWARVVTGDTRGL